MSPDQTNTAEAVEPSVTELIGFLAGRLPSGATISGLSWNGFNVYGDAKSMAEVQRMQHAAGRAESLTSIIKSERSDSKAELDRLRSRIMELEELVAEFTWSAFLAAGGDVPADDEGSST